MLCVTVFLCAGCSLRPPKKGLLHFDILNFCISKQTNPGWRYRQNAWDLQVFRTPALMSL